MSNSLIDQNAVQVAETLRDRYREGLPAAYTESEGRLLRPQEVLSNDLDLGVCDHPLVLAVIATRDPYLPMALAASVRLMPRASKQALLAEMMHMIEDSTEHRAVREAVGISARRRFEPRFVSQVQSVTKGHIDRCRQESMSRLACTLKAVMNDGPVPETFVRDLVQLSYRSDLRPDMMRQIVLNILRAENLRARVKLMLIENLTLFPTDLQIEIITQVNAVAREPRHAYLKAELTHALEQMGWTPPSKRGGGNRPALFGLSQGSELVRGQHDTGWNGDTRSDPGGQSIHARSGTVAGSGLLANASGSVAGSGRAPRAANVSNSDRLDARNATRRGHGSPAATNSAGTAAGGRAPETGQSAGADAWRTPTGKRIIPWTDYLVKVSR